MSDLKRKKIYGKRKTRHISSGQRIPSVSRLDQRLNMNLEPCTLTPFVGIIPSDFSSKRVQNQTCLSYAERENRRQTEGIVELA